MGQCYTVYLKLEFVDEAGAIKALQDKIARGAKERTAYNLWHYEDLGIGTETLPDLLNIYYGGWEGKLRKSIVRVKGKEWDYYGSDFNASYGWHRVMCEAFEAMAPYLADDSELKIYPDSGVEIYTVRDGRVGGSEDMAITGRGTRVFLSYIQDCEPNTGGWYVEIYVNPYGDRYDDFCIHPEDCDCTNWDEVGRFAKNYVSSIMDY